MKKILIPTDFSEFADMATEMAIMLAKSNGAEIHFVHLMEIPIDWINLDVDDQHKRYPDITSKFKLANRKLVALIEKVEKTGLKARGLIQFNSDYEYIIEYTKLFNCDFIVMGSHGTSGIAEWFVGSNAQRIVRNSKVPVLTVKHHPKGVKFTDIVFVSDFDRDKFSSFKWVLDFARDMNAKMHLLFINTPSSFTETPVTDLKMKPFIKEGGADIIESRVYNCYDFEEGLSEYVKGESFSKGDDQLIAIVTHGGKSSLTESLINHLDDSILSIRMSEA